MDYLYVATYQATEKIASNLKSLLSALNGRLVSSDFPWEAFKKLQTNDQLRNFIRAAAHLFPEEVFRQTRLITAIPPDNVHRMQRSDPYYVGDLHSANIVVHALQLCGLLDDRKYILDIGCSSGSLVRVLAAFEAMWDVYGCVPIASAIRWADEVITTGQFSDMSNKPR